MKFLSDILVKAGLVVENTFSANAATNTIYAGTGTRLRTEANNLVFERVSSSGTMKMMFTQGTLSPTAKAYIGYSNATLNLILSNEYATAGLELRTSDIIRQQIFANGNIVIGQASPVDAGYKVDITGTVRATGVITASILAGTGTRMVVADSSGVLSTQAIVNPAAVLPVGGTTGQILAKIDNTNYNTEWIDNYTGTVKHVVKAGVALTKGQAVYVSSADGTNMIVSKASNAGESTSSKTMGLIAQSLNANDSGYVVTEGLLSGIDTSTAQAGDPVWLGTDGNLLFGLANKPYAPNHMVYIGVVTRVQQNNGEIFVKVQNGFELNELHDVYLPTYISNGILYRDTVNDLWKTASIETVLGYTPVTNARTLTINGTTYDLTTNRSWSVGTTTGSGSVGQVAYWSGSSTQTGSNSFFWDTVNERLGIGLTNPQRKIEIYSATADSHLRLTGNAPSVSLGEATTGSVYQAKFGLATASGQYASAAIAGDFVIISQTGATIWGTGSTERMRLSFAGNFIVGSSSDSTLAKLQINGSIQQAGVTSSMIKVDSNGVIVAASAGSDFVAPATLASYVPTSRTITINGVSYDLSADRSWTIAGGVTSFNTRTGAITLTSGDVTGALGYTPYNSSNPAGYITGYTETDTLASVTARGATTTSAITINKTGTLISHAGMSDAIGYNSSYGTYIGSTVGGTYYIYANGQMNNNGSIVTLLHSSNYSSFLDSRYIYATSNPNTAGNFTLSIGNNGSYSYVQSHSGQPLELNPVGNAVRISGNIALHAGNYNSYSPTLTGGGASGTWGVRITGFANQGSQRLYSTDAAYNYDAANPYFGYLTYDGTRWLFQVSPGTPAAVRVAYADSAGSASSASTSSQVSINYNNDSNANYQLLWGSGNSVYGTGSVYVNPSSDTIYAVSYRGSGNVGGTGEASNHPAGIFSQGTNWLYGTIYLNNNSIQDAANIYNSGWYRNYGQTGLYNQTYDNHIVSHDTSYWKIASANGIQIYDKGIANLKGYLYFDSSGFGLLNNQGGWSVLAYQGSGYGGELRGSWTSTSDMRAPIFYDSNNTSYYLDPAGTSVLGGGTDSDVIQMSNSSYGAYLLLGGWTTDTSHSRIRVSNGNLHMDAKGGAYDIYLNWYTSRPVYFGGGQYVAGTIYDNSNTGYYLKPSSTSRMNAIVYDNLYFSGDQTYGLFGRNAYVDTINGRGSDPLELNYYDGGSVIIGSGGTGSKALYAGSLYDSGNRVLTYAGANLSSVYYFTSDRNTDSSNPPLQAYSGNGSGAIMSFHRGGYYAVNFGLDSDNVMRIGGWSASANRWQLDMSGNNTVAGSFRAPIFYDSEDTSYYLDPNSTSRLYYVNAPQGYVSIGNPWGTANSAFFPNGITTAGGTNWIYGFTYIGNAPANGAGHEFNANGSMRSTSSHRATIYYDDSDTTYYVDPGGNGTRAAFLNGNIWISPKSESYGEGIAFLMPSQATWGGLRWLRSVGDYTGAWAFGYFGNESNNNIGFHSAGTNGWRLDHSWNMTVIGTITSPVLYASDSVRYSGAVSENSTFGIYFGNDRSSAYGIYREAGGWNHPYPDLRIAFHTGIKIGANAGYGGIKFYSDYDMSTIVASINDGDTNMRGYYDIIAYASDRRLKENVKVIDNAIDKVKQLTGMTYNWNSVGAQYGWSPSSEREAGVFAQDVQAVLPEAVKLAPFDSELGKSKSGENFLTVKYEKIVPLLIEAIKEQQIQIEELKGQLDGITK